MVKKDQKIFVLLSEIFVCKKQKISDLVTRQQGKSNNNKQKALNSDSSPILYFRHKMRRIKIFAGNSNHDLAYQICERLQLDRAKIVIGKKISTRETLLVFIL